MECSHSDLRMLFPQRLQGAVGGEESVDASPPGDCASAILFSRNEQAQIEMGIHTLSLGECHSPPGDCTSEILCLRGNQWQSGEASVDAASPGDCTSESRYSLDHQTQSEEMSVDESSRDFYASEFQFSLDNRMRDESCYTHSSEAPDATVQEEKQDLIDSGRESDRSRHQRKRPMLNSPRSERRDPLKRRRTAEEKRPQDALESLFENMLQVSDTDITAVMIYSRLKLDSKEMITKNLRRFGIHIDAREIREYTHTKSMQRNHTLIEFYERSCAKRVHEAIRCLPRETRRVINSCMREQTPLIEDEKESYTREPEESHFRGFKAPKEMQSWLKNLPKVKELQGSNYSRVATWNIQTLNGRLDHLQAILHHYKISILGLTEVRGQAEIDFPEYKWIFRRKPGSTYGIGFLIHLSLLERVRIEDKSSLRTLFLSVQGPHQIRPTLFGLYYGQSALKVGVAFRKQWQTYKEELVRIRAEYGNDCIIMGDFNARIGMAADAGEQYILGKYGEDIRRGPAGQAMVDFIQSGNLVSLNNRREAAVMPEYTFKCLPRNQKSIIDYILVSKEMMREEYHAVVLPIAITGAEGHRMVMADIRLHRRTNYEMDRNPSSRVNTGLLVKEEVQERYAQSRDNEMGKIDWNALNVDCAAEKVSQIIIETAKEILGVTRKKCTTSKMEKRIENARANLQKMLVQGTRQENLHAKRKLAGLLCKQRISRHRRFVKRIIRSKRDPRRMYQGIRKLCGLGPKKKGIQALRKRDGTLTFEKSEIHRLQTEYCAKMSQKDVASGRQRISVEREIESSCYDRITTKEITAAIDKLGRNKAAGSDEITAELVKDKSEMLINVLTKILNKSWANGVFPRIWCKGAIQLLHKKGTKYDLDNYRQITVQCTIRQIFCRVIENRLKEFTMLNECQNGFRSGRSSSDNLFIVNNLIKECTGRFSRSSAFLAFIDFRKAFDSLDTGTLMTKLKQRGVGGNMLQIIRSMYQRSQSAVRHCGQLGNYFKVEKGVAQGCILSPLLFAIYLDDLLTSLQEVRVGEGILTSCLAYADDLLLLARTKEDLQEMLTRIENWCNVNSMRVNTKKEKSAIMPIGVHIQETPQFKIHDEPIETVSSYKYIGFTMNKDGKWGEHIEKTISKAYGLLAANSKFLRDNTLPVQTRLAAGQALVLSILKYGENVIPVSAKLAKKMESVQTSMHRAILDMPWGTKAAAMRLLLGRPTLRIIREDARIKYLQKVGCLPRERLVRQIYSKTRDKIKERWYSKADLARLIRTKRVDSAQKHLSRSHARRVLKLSNGYLHPIFRKIGKYRECMAKWMIGATDVYEDIEGQRALVRGQSRKCRLCKEKDESKRHLLLECKETARLRGDLLEVLKNYNIRQMLDEAPEDNLTMLFSSFEVPMKFGHIRDLTHIEEGFNINNIHDIAELERRSPGSLMVCINVEQIGSKTMSAALEIFNEQGTWRRECVHINTENVFEAGTIAATMAIGLINLAWTEESGPDRIHILSMNPGFASSIVKIRLQPEPNRVPGELSMELEKLHGSIRVISHYFNKEISLSFPYSKYGGYSSRKATHAGPSSANVLGEEGREKKYQSNTDKIARYIYAVNKRLPTRRNMKTFQGFR
jgi:exonuclease III